MRCIFFSRFQSWRIMPIVMRSALGSKSSKKSPLAVPIRPLSPAPSPPLRPRLSFTDQLRKDSATTEFNRKLNTVHRSGVAPDEVLLLVDERDGQLPRRQLRLFESVLERRLNNRGGELVPYPPRRRGAILEAFSVAGSIAIVPAIEGGPWDAELPQGAPHRQRRLLDQPDDLQLLGGRVSHISASPSPSTLFLSTRFSTISSANSSLSW